MHIWRYDCPASILGHIDLIERTFQREGSPYLACNNRNAFLLRKTLKNIMHGHVKMYVMRRPVGQHFGSRSDWTKCRT